MLLIFILFLIFRFAHLENYYNRNELFHSAEVLYIILATIKSGFVIILLKRRESNLSNSDPLPFLEIIKEPPGHWRRVSAVEFIVVLLTNIIYSFFKK